MTDTRALDVGRGWAVYNKKGEVNTERAHDSFSVFTYREAAEEFSDAEGGDLVCRVFIVPICRGDIKITNAPRHRRDHGRTNNRGGMNNGDDG